MFTQLNAVKIASEWARRALVGWELGMEGGMRLACGECREALFSLPGESSCLRRRCRGLSCARAYFWWERKGPRKGHPPLVRGETLQSKQPVQCQLDAQCHQTHTVFRDAASACGPRRTPTRSARAPLLAYCARVVFSLCLRCQRPTLCYTVGALQGDASFSTSWFVMLSVQYQLT